MHGQGLKVVLDIVGNHGSPAYTMPTEQPMFGQVYDRDGKLVADHQDLPPAKLDPAHNPLHALHSSLQLFADVKRDLPQVTAPMLLMRSAVDHVVPLSSGEYVKARVSSTDLTDVTLHDSYHVATLDEDAPLVFARSREFVSRVSSGVPA